MGALEKLIRGTEWGGLDVLYVDMPPGTGDAHISISQKLPLAGAVIVSTPQEAALLDARRGVDLYRKVGIDILGMVQNMAYLDAGGGARLHLFGDGGVARCAAEEGTELLGEVPIVMARRHRGFRPPPPPPFDRRPFGRPLEAAPCGRASSLQEIRVGSDAGKPVAAEAEGFPGRDVYHSIARRLGRKLGIA